MFCCVMWYRGERYREKNHDCGFSCYSWFLIELVFCFWYGRTVGFFTVEDDSNAVHFYAGMC